MNMCVLFIQLSCNLACDCWFHPSRAVIGCLCLASAIYVQINVHWILRSWKNIFANMSHRKINFIGTRRQIQIIRINWKKCQNMRLLLLNIKNLIVRWTFVRRSILWMKKQLVLPPNMLVTVHELEWALTSHKNDKKKKTQQKKPWKNFSIKFRSKFFYALLCLRIKHEKQDQKKIFMTKKPQKWQLKFSSLLMLLCWCWKGAVKFK